MTLTPTEWWITAAVVFGLAVGIFLEERKYRRQVVRNREQRWGRQ